MNRLSGVFFIWLYYKFCTLKYYFIRPPSTTLRFKNYFRTSPWDIYYAKFVSKYIYKKILKWGIPESPFKNSFIIKYRIFKYNNDKNNEITKKYKKKYVADLFFKDCFNFYHYSKVPTSFKGNVVEVKTKVLKYNVLKNDKGLFYYFFNPRIHWLMSSFVLENHYRHTLLSLQESIREYIWKNPYLYPGWIDKRLNVSRNKDAPIYDRTEGVYFRGIDTFGLNDFSKKKLVRHIGLESNFYTWTDEDNADSRGDSRQILASRKYFTDIKKRKRKKKWRDMISIPPDISKPYVINLGGMKVRVFRKPRGVYERVIRTEFEHFKYGFSKWRHPGYYLDNWFRGAIPLVSQMYTINFFRRELFRRMNWEIPYIPGRPRFVYLNKRTVRRLVWKFRTNSEHIDRSYIGTGKFNNLQLMSFIYCKQFVDGALPEDSAWYEFWTWKPDYYLMDRKDDTPAYVMTQLKPYKILDKNYYNKVWNDSLESVANVGDEAERKERRKHINRIRNFIPETKKFLYKTVIYPIKWILSVPLMRTIYIIARSIVLTFRAIELTRLAIECSVPVVCLRYFHWYIFSFLPYYWFHMSPVYGTIFYRISLWKVRLRAKLWERRWLEDKFRKAAEKRTSFAFRYDNIQFKTDNIKPNGYRRLRRYTKLLFKKFSYLPRPEFVLKRKIKLRLKLLRLNIYLKIYCWIRGGEFEERLKNIELNKNNYLNVNLYFIGKKKNFRNIRIEKRGFANFYTKKNKKK